VTEVSRCSSQQHASQQTQASVISIAEEILASTCPSTVCPSTDSLSFHCNCQIGCISTTSLTMPACVRSGVDQQTMYCSLRASAVSETAVNHEIAHSGLNMLTQLKRL
jgi:hypothetical protein